MSANNDGAPHPAASQRRRPRLLEWQAELNASPGHRAVSLMEYVRRIGYVFQANVKQYKELVARMQDPSFALPVLDTGNLRAHDELLSEVERLLHNILMALSTRIDQQRAFINRHFSDDTALIAEYAAKIRTDFGAYAPSVFLQDLRNYLTHYELPVARSRLTISSQSFAVTFLVVRRRLQEWQGWRSEVKVWLSGQDEEIDIVPILDNYARIAGGFDKWLYERIGRKYETEIREYYGEAEEFNREHSRVFGS